MQKGFNRPGPSVKPVRCANASEEKGVYGTSLGPTYYFLLTLSGQKRVAWWMGWDWAQPWITLYNDLAWRCFGFTLRLAGST